MLTTERAYPPYPQGFCSSTVEARASNAVFAACKATFVAARLANVEAAVDNCALIVAVNDCIEAIATPVDVTVDVTIDNVAELDANCVFAVAIFPEIAALTVVTRLETLVRVV